MNFVFSVFLFLIFGFVKGQVTVVDSVENKIEKYYNIGISDSTRSHLKNQISNMDKYIAKDSLNSQAFLQRGIYYTQLGAQVKAIKDYDRAIELDPSESIAYYNRALAKSRFRYTLDACIDLKKSEQLGIKQAGTIYTSYCRLYHAKIEKKFVPK
jgi:tetratricopeptide (TPR) repeat protein